MNHGQWHGDNELAPGLLDFAVNVRLPSPPDWLVEVISQTIPHLGSYPDPRAATEALARHHEVDPAMVLPLAGGAEGFTLVARAGAFGPVLVVHPQFTEPDAALRAAGRTPDHLVLAPPFRLDPGTVPTGPTLVVIGNPTNPTGALHPAADLRTLTRPGRMLVVDEAFMDAVPGEPETLIAPEMPGIVVLRSLTKTWGLAGLRAGYAVGDPTLIAQLRRQQTHWSVSTPALAVMSAVCTARGRAETRAGAQRTAAARAYLRKGLTDLGLVVAGDPQTPFVLVNASGAGVDVRAGLRGRGIAVRRGDTFPGLSPAWFRVAVRDRATTDVLLQALAGLLPLGKVAGDGTRAAGTVTASE